MNERHKYTGASSTYEVKLRSGGVMRIEAHTLEIEGGHAVFMNWDGLVKAVNCHVWESIEKVQEEG